MDAEGNDKVPTNERKEDKEDNKKLENLELDIDNAEFNFHDDDIEKQLEELRLQEELEKKGKAEKLSELIKAKESAKPPSVAQSPSSSKGAKVEVAPKNEKQADLAKKDSIKEKPKEPEPRPAKIVVPEKEKAKEDVKEKEPASAKLKEQVKEKEPVSAKLKEQVKEKEPVSAKIKEQVKDKEPVSAKLKEQVKEKEPAPAKVKEMVKEKDKFLDLAKELGMVPEKKQNKPDIAGLIEKRDKIFQEKDLKIMKLKQMNNKLAKELKILSSNLDKSLEKTRAKSKPANPYNDANLKARAVELEEAQKQIKNYQKEIASLKAKLDAKTGYEKIIDLENKLKEGEMKNQEILKEIKALEQIKANQEKELDKITGNSEANNKIKTLNEQLKSTKEKNKELEKRIQSESASYQKQHNHLLDLQEKYQKLKKDKVMWKKAIAEKKLPPSESSGNPDKKSEAEILTASINSLQKKIALEKGTAKKTIEKLKSDISDYQNKIKEAEQENRLNTVKLADLKKSMRHNQLKPLGADNQLEETAPIAELHLAKKSPQNKGNAEEHVRVEVDIDAQAKNEKDADNQHLKDLEMELDND